MASRVGLFSFLSAGAARALALAQCGLSFPRGRLSARPQAASLPAPLTPAAASIPPSAPLRLTLVRNLFFQVPGEFLRPNPLRMMPVKFVKLRNGTFHMNSALAELRL